MSGKRMKRPADTGSTVGKRAAATPRMSSGGSGSTGVSLTNRILASPSTVTLDHGKSASTELLINLAVPHDAVTPTISRLPAGVTFSFDPGSLGRSPSESAYGTKLTLTASGSAPAGERSCIVTAGTASGSLMVAVTSPYSMISGAADVSIEASGAPPSISSPFQLMLGAFGSVRAPMNVHVQAGVEGTISFDVRGLPPGVSAQVDPQTISAMGVGVYGVETTLSAGAQVTPVTVTVTVDVLLGGLKRGSVSFPLEIVGLSVSFVGPLAGSVPMFGEPGTPVTIEGFGLGPGTTVAFGIDDPVAPTSFAADLDGSTSLVVAVPASAVSGALTVTSAAGATATSSSFAVDSFRNTRGFRFPNDPTFQGLVGSQYTFDDAVALFGRGATHIAGIPVPHGLIESFLSAASLILDSVGQCYGFSLASIRFGAGQHSMAGLPTSTPEPGGPAGPDAWLLEGGVGDHGENLSPSLAAFIHQQHLAQLSQENIDQWLSFHLNVTSAASLRSELLAAFRAEGHNRGAMVCMEHSLGDGHCVLAYDIADHADGSFDILLYNPNVPFAATEDTEQDSHAGARGSSIINVDVHGNWTLPFLGWTGSLVSLTVVPWDAIPVQPSPPWAEMATLAAVFAWVVVGDAELTQVADAGGRTLLADGAWNRDPATQLAGVRTMPALGGLGIESPPAVVGTNAESLTATVVGRAEGTYTTIRISPGSAVELKDVPTKAGSTDTVRLAANTVDFAPSEEKQVTVAMTGIGVSSHRPRTATLSTRASGGAPVGLDFDPASETFAYVHAGASAEFTLELSTIDAAGKPVSYTTRPAVAAQGQTLTFRPDWERLASGVGVVALHGTPESPGSRKLSP
jgi:hypothetical protein